MSYSTTAPQLKTWQNWTPQQRAAAEQLGGYLSGSIIPNQPQGGGRHGQDFRSQFQKPSPQGVPTINNGLGAAAPSNPEWQRLYNQNNKFDPTGGAVGQQAQNTYANVMNSQFTPVQTPNALNAQNVQNWFQNSVAAPAMLNYNQNIAPAINESFAGQGGIFNSRRGYAQGQALQQMNTDELSQLGKVSYDANMQQANMQNQANIFNAQGQQAQLALNMQGAAGAQNQLSQNQGRFLNQLGANQQIQGQSNYVQQGMFNEALRTAPYDNPAIQQAMAYLGLNGLTQVPYTPMSTGAMIGQGLGAANQAVGLYNSMFPASYGAAAGAAAGSAGAFGAGEAAGALGGYGAASGAAAGAGSAIDWGAIAAM